MSTIPAMNENEFAMWSEYLEKVCGIHLGKQKAYLFTGKLMGLIKESESKSFGDFLYKVQNDNTKKLEKEIVETMTTKETLWFRDVKPFKILEEALLKELAKKSMIRIWCAATSYGQEPYSIALTILEMKRKGIPINPDKVDILATDISDRALHFAKEGKYDSLAISRGLAPDIRNNYFEQVERYWKIKDCAKKMIRFQNLNLKNPFLHLGHKDIIFCRNVCIYFSEILKKQIFRNIASLLRPEHGFLFLGAAESLSTYSNEFQLLSHSGGIYYKVK